MKKFIKEALSELYNVSWPTKKHAINISKVTIIFTIICAIFIWTSDYILAEAYKVWSSMNPENAVQIQQSTEEPLRQSTQEPLEIKLDWTNTWALKIVPTETGTNTWETL